jgi:hypothetical protein
VVREDTNHGGEMWFVMTGTMAEDHEGASHRPRMIPKEVTPFSD